MKFLRVFWQKHDPTPGTPINERLIEHIRRMRHADDNFSSMPGERGAETHKGRVYVKYGPPDDIERSVLSSDGRKSFEVWHYGRHDFVFQDRNGLGAGAEREKPAGFSESAIPELSPSYSIRR